MYRFLVEFQWITGKFYTCPFEEGEAGEIEKGGGWGFCPVCWCGEGFSLFLLADETWNG